MKPRVRIPAGASGTLRASHRLLHCHWSCNQQKLAPGRAELGVVFLGVCAGHISTGACVMEHHRPYQSAANYAAWCLSCQLCLQPEETLPGSPSPSLGPQARAGSSSEGREGGRWRLWSHGAGNGKHLGRVEVKESPGGGAWVQPWEPGARPGLLSPHWMLLSREHPALQ